ncbi:DNA helicase RecQ [Pararoseomonas sp. SCSIO 73927]|uniref:DNA helicase RecQ n=1 Tax=Pararoseomonas sp. SCSIO 73927 TaxID=3114537 RepID=UPI0030D2D7A6
MTADPRQVLHDVFGFADFRGRQAEIVAHVTSGGSGLVLMPTGGGKSLCYQVPALCRAGLGVVVSPLIALMEDQVAALRQQGVAAAALHSGLDEEERRRVSLDLSNGKLKLLYVSPERLAVEGTAERLARRDIALFAVDEAHCISAWGHNFRPEYRGLTMLAERFPEVPRVALTATADARTVDDIRERLSLTDAPVFRGSFDRPNIRIEVAPRENPTAQIAAFMDEADDGRGAGIIYCPSRAETERTAARLKRDGYDALHYHAGMDAADRRAAERRFSSGDPVVMAATIAFGMGIDRPDVRWVAHLALPGGPESWYQEIGRAGRDGAAARAMLLYGAEDIAVARRRIVESPAADGQKRLDHERLDRLVAIVESATCRRRLLLRCFGDDLPEDCGNCDACLNPPRLVDATEAARKLLSAVHRTGGRFGLGYVVDVLRGKPLDRITSLGHDKLSVFGIGRDVAEGAWKNIARHLLAHGALELAADTTLPVYQATEAARPILRGQEPVLLQERALREAARAPRRGRARSAPSTVSFAEGPVETGVFDALRAWRKEEATRQSVPAYVIFPDRTLAEIAAQRPRTLDGLAEVHGVGASKLDRYGLDVLRVLREAG